MEIALKDNDPMENALMGIGLVKTVLPSANNWILRLVCPDPKVVTISD